MTAPRVQINVFHPDLAASRANRLIVKELRQLPGAAVRDIQKVYPDWKIDVAREQELLLAHDLVVFQHPFYWFNCPALMKLWMDEVLTQGFAYPPGIGDRLRGKAWLSSITTGGPWEAYRSGGFNNWTISELLRPFRQSALLAGMTWRLPRTRFGSAPQITSGTGQVITSDPQFWIVRADGGSRLQFKA